MIAVDVPRMRQYSNSGTKMAFAPLAFVGTPLEWLNSTTFATANGTFMMISGAKYVNSAAPPFSDPFAWLPGANYDGDEVVNGTKVHRWSIKVEHLGVAMLLKVTEDGTPVEYDLNATIKVRGRRAPP